MSVSESDIAFAHELFEGLGAASITDDLWFLSDDQVISLERRAHDPCLVVWDLGAGTHEIIEIQRDDVGFVSKIAVADSRIALLTSDSVTIAQLSA